MPSGGEGGGRGRVINVCDGGWGGVRGSVNAYLLCLLYVVFGIDPTTYKRDCCPSFFCGPGDRRDLLVLRPRCPLGTGDQPRPLLGVLPPDEALRHEAHEAADERDSRARGVWQVCALTFEGVFLLLMTGNKRYRRNTFF